MLRKLSALILIALALSGLTAVLQPITVGAVGPFDVACQTGGANSSVCKAKSQPNNPLTGSDGILTKVANLLALVGGVMVVIVIIIGGIKYITSNGDSSATASAKNTIIYGVVGLVVIILARGIVSFVVTKI